jgi:hypothetical protein
MAEGVGIEPTGDKIFAPRTALKAGTATRRHPLPCSIYGPRRDPATGVFAAADSTFRCVRVHQLCNGMLKRHHSKLANLPYVNEYHIRLRPAKGLLFDTRINDPDKAGLCTRKHKRPESFDSGLDSLPSCIYQSSGVGST